MVDRPANVMMVVGARPQFIKAAAVQRAVERANRDAPRIHAEIVHTGQHYDHGMSRVFFDEMEIPEPVVNLGVGSAAHGAMTGRMLEGLERTIVERRPDLVLTFGDTNSTLAAALASAKLHVPTAHVEAGMRSFNRRMPEEINRVVADRVSDALFCASESSRALLAAEGVTENVHVVGDVMLDAALHYRSRAIPPDMKEPFILATLHREENVEDADRLRSILRALTRAPHRVVLPAHPRTRERIAALEDNYLDRSRLRIVEPISYFRMLGHLERCRFVMTDSGGLQKEAFYFGKKCITLRDETEWTELVEAGVNRVPGADAAKIQAAFAWADAPLADVPKLFGEGDAADRIVEILLRR